MSSTRRRGNKARVHDKIARKRQRSKSRVLVNQIQTIQPELLQRAMKDGRVARPETIMQLQRMVGNRAVDNQLASQSGSTQLVQRLVDFNFSANVGAWAGATKQHDKKFSAIMGAYKKYKKATTSEEEYNGLKNLIKLSGDWLFKYAEKYESRKKVDDVQRLLKLCQSEFVQVEYMYKMENDKFEFLTSTGSSAHRHDQTEQAFAAQHNLTKSELTAIKVYTAGDYDYINPTFAENEGWLDSKIKKLAGPTIAYMGDQKMEFPSQWQSKGWRSKVESKGTSLEQKKQIKQEAKQHGQMAIEGLRKLPNWDGGAAYRGMGLPDKQIKKEYQKGGTVTYNTFTSTTDKSETARKFAADNSTGEKVGMFFKINVNQGKDITMFSEVKSESEILLLPGATFTVDKIQPPDPANKFYQIELTQTS